MERVFKERVAQLAVRLELVTREQLQPILETTSGSLLRRMLDEGLSARPIWTTPIDKGVARRYVGAALVESPSALGLITLTAEGALTWWVAGR